MLNKLSVMNDDACVMYQCFCLIILLYCIVMLIVFKTVLSMYETNDINYIASLEIACTVAFFDIIVYFNQE